MPGRAYRNAVVPCTMGVRRNFGMNPILDSKGIAELEKFDVPTISNALECFDSKYRLEGFSKPGLAQRTGLGGTMVGYAVTAKVSAAAPAKGDAAARLYRYYEELRSCPDPAIAVIEDIDSEPVGSFWGEVQASAHLALGCAGAITEGGARDLAEVSALGLRLYSTAVLVSHAHIHLEDSGCPVRVRGLEIRSGDLLACDIHGTIVIPASVAPFLAEACRRIAASELPMLEPLRRSIAEGRKPEISELRAWREEMHRLRNEAVAEFGDKGC